MQEQYIQHFYQSYNTFHHESLILSVMYSNIVPQELSPVPAKDYGGKINKSTNMNES